MFDHIREFSEAIRKVNEEWNAERFAPGSQAHEWKLKMEKNVSALSRAFKLRTMGAPKELIDAIAGMGFDDIESIVTGENGLENAVFGAFNDALATITARSLGGMTMLLRGDPAGKANQETFPTGTEVIEFIVEAMEKEKIVAKFRGPEEIDLFFRRAAWAEGAISIYLTFLLTFAPPKTELLVELAEQVVRIIAELEYETIRALHGPGEILDIAKQHAEFICQAMMDQTLESALRKPGGSDGNS